jgi:hypothetical protein
MSSIGHRSSAPITSRHPKAHSKSAMKKDKITQISNSYYMDLVFTPRTQTTSRLSDTPDRDTRKKVMADHLFEPLEFQIKSFSVRTTFCVKTPT